MVIIRIVIIYTNDSLSSRNAFRHKKKWEIVVEWEMGNDKVNTNS